MRRVAVIAAIVGLGQDGRQIGVKGHAAEDAVTLHYPGLPKPLQSMCAPVKPRSLDAQLTGVQASDSARYARAALTCVRARERVACSCSGDVTGRAARGVPPEAALDPKIEYKLKMIGARRLAMAGLLMLIDRNRSQGFEPTSTPCEYFRSLC